MLLGDNDFRNGNTGILIDVKNKKFRPLPNFDMEKCFSSLTNSYRFEYLKEFYELYPEDYDNFIQKMFELFKESEKGEVLDVKMARKAIREESIANSILYTMYNNASEIWNATMKFKKSYGDNEKAKEILA